MSRKFSVAKESGVVARAMVSEPALNLPRPTEPISGAEVVVQSLLHHGVTTIFAYPGGASMPLHQALTRYRDKIRVVLPRHEQGGGFAAQGYARSTGRIGVCMSTSGPGATNLVTPIADAKLDSVPLLALTGQVSTPVIGTDAFQETPIVEVCRSVTKHHYLVTNVHDLPRIMREAFYVATTGRPGPVLVDLPKNIQQAQTIPDYNVPMDLPGYQVYDHAAQPEQIEEVARLIRQSKRPLILAGGGLICAEASEELRCLVQKTGIPVAMTLRGLGSFPGDHPLSLDMIGMHGSVYANYAAYECDLLLALGVRFVDRVTGKVSEFAKHAKIVHIDIDPSEINKVKQAYLGIVSDLKYALQMLNEIVQAPEDLSEWHRKIDAWKKADPLTYDRSFPGILPQRAIHELWKLTKDRPTIIATGVGQHQMWTAQFYKFSRPRMFLSSGGLGTMGFGLPAAIGAKIAHPDMLVIDIDGDGSLLMNIQELATCYCEEVPVKVMLMNNMHLGMVVQWEDRFHQGNRAHTYLGPIHHPEAFGRGDDIYPKERYPDFVAVARSFGWEARVARDSKELLEGIRAMIASDGPFLLDVHIPYQEHVLPMIPAGMTVNELIRK